MKKKRFSTEQIVAVLAIKASTGVHFGSADHRRILMGHGRNAIDVALLRSFGTSVMIGFK
jgi:hypothetical protein